MKALTSVLVALLLVGLVVARAEAQGQRGPRMSVDERVAQMKSELALTDDQASKVKEILTVEREQAMKDREKMAGDRDAMMKAMQTRLQETDRKIEALLTADQKPKYAKMREEEKKRMEERMRERGVQPGGPPQKQSPTKE